MNVIDFFTSNLLELTTYITDANKRLYWIYLSSAIVLALPVYYLAKRKENQNAQSTQSTGNFFSYLFPKKIYLSSSARIDYQLLIVNKFIKAALFPLIIFTMAPIALSVSSGMESVLGQRDFLSWSTTSIVITFTFILFLFDDFSRFLLHYAMHKVPFLWEFHKVHHSATVLTPFTIYRSHPLENYLYACRMALSQGIAVGLCYYLFGPTLKMVDILGANVFIFLFNVFGSNLRHSHVWLSFGKHVENWIISPAQHQIHHSDNPKHFDANLGTALAIWDRLFRTHIKAEGVKDITFGISKHYTPEHTTLLKVYYKPFTTLFKK